MIDSDRQLATRARDGDRQALDALYQRHAGRLLGFLVRNLGRRELAEDVFQEVWIKVIHSIHRYDPGPANFRAWLFRIGANAAIDRQRLEARRQGPELDAPVGDGAERQIDRVPSTDADPERLGLSARLGQALDSALDDLRDDQRAAILLRHQQGLSYPEIAAALSIPEGTAKTMVHRGVRLLRRKLARWE